MKRSGTLRVGFAVAILVALVLYFAPIVPVQTSCASIPRGANIPYNCISATEVTSYNSPMRTLFGFGAYSDYSGYYSPEVAYGNGYALTTSGVFGNIILPAILVACLLLLGKNGLTRISRPMRRLLDRA